MQDVTVLSAHLTVKTASGEKLSFRAFDKILLDIAQKQPNKLTKIAVMKSKPFSLYHTQGIFAPSPAHHVNRLS